MVEEETHSIETVLFEPPHVPGDVVGVEPKRRPGAVFRANPIDALDVELYEVAATPSRIQFAVLPLKVERVWRESIVVIWRHRRARWVER